MNSEQHDSQPAGDAADREDEGEHDGETAAGATLSPSVRRLVRQYDLDITAIRGSGPAGRVRVGDVMHALGSRAAPVGENGEPREPGQPVPRHSSEPGRDMEITAAVAVTWPTTSIFECDIGNVMAHRQRACERGQPVDLTCYFAAACTRALRAVPEINGGEGPVHVDVVRSTAGGTTVTALRNVEGLSLKALEGALRRSARQAEAGAAGPAAETEPSGARFQIHDYGSSGSLLTVPTPLRGGQTASLGLGRPRRQIVIRNVDGEEAPRAAAVCYVTLTFDAARVSLARANLCLAELVRAIERWPLD